MNRKRTEGAREREAEAVREKSERETEDIFDYVGV